MNKILILIFIILFASCGNSRSMNNPGVPIHVLIDSIETNGSIRAFNLLEIASLDYRAGEFLSTYLIMADKYDNSFACMAVYYQTVLMYNIPQINDSKNGIYMLDSLNSDARKMAIRYLIKSDSLGNQEAKKHLKEYRQLRLIK